MKAVINNPIVKGFHPDPSICRKGDDFYLVTSSFEYFPALPIFHSRDLANWKQIGFGITDSSLIDLSDCVSGRGIYAPTIRYNEFDDTFYIITTLVHNDIYQENETFFIKAKDPSGPWYGYTKVVDAEGIDPSLYFEKDKAWYVGNMRPGPTVKRKRYIYISQIDLETGRFIGEKKILLTDGAVHDAVCPEGPHIYKFGIFYYLLIAEGGTGLNHAVSVFRSQNVDGPYEINPRNPIMTHRMLSRSSQFNSIGHADIVELKDHSMWACMLGIRPYGDYRYRNLGRETFLAPVIWEDGWPVISPETGKIEESYVSSLDEDEGIDFVINDGLPFEFHTIRTSKSPVYRLKGGSLELLINKYSFADIASCALVVRRQDSMNFNAETEMDFTPIGENEEAGVIIEYSSKAFFMMTKTLRAGEDVLVIKSHDGILYEKKIEKGRIKIRICAKLLDYYFQIFHDGHWENVGPVLDGRELSTHDVGFTGTMIGLYGSSNGKTSDSIASYRYFSYSRF